MVASKLFKRSVGTLTVAEFPWAKGANAVQIFFDCSICTIEKIQNMIDVYHMSKYDQNHK